VAEGTQFLGGGFHLQDHLPVAAVVAEGDGAAIGGAEAAGGAEDEELLAAQVGRVPAHADILAPAEEVAAGSVAEHVVGERQATGRALGGGLHIEEGGIRIDQGGKRGCSGSGHAIS